MKKTFNATGICYPDEHYMVNIDERLKQVQALIDDGKYFAINRARQYGKTTMLHMLTQKLSCEYQISSAGLYGFAT